MTDEKAAEEFVQFLRISSEPGLKVAAIKHALALTSSPAGVTFIIQHKDIFEAILALLKDTAEEVADEAYKTVINLSADDGAMKHILDNYDIMTDLINTVCDPNSCHADVACKILNNFTRTKDGSVSFLKACSKKSDEKEEKSVIKDSTLKIIIDDFCKINFNQKGSTLDHVASILANVTQTEEGRTVLLSRSQPVIGCLLPFLNHDSVPLERRRGVSMAIKNCCFEHVHHEWLLSEEVDILSRLLLPLAGNEEFTEGETEDLLIDLQYLPDDKTREPDPGIRRTLLEALLLLCADTFGRKLLKDSGTYYIIRELHNWELENGPEENGEQCEKLIQILIADEPEPGMENLMEIPEERLKKFEQK